MAATLVAMLTLTQSRALSRSRSPLQTMAMKAGPQASSVYITMMSTTVEISSSMALFLMT